MARHIAAHNCQQIKFAINYNTSLLDRFINTNLHVVHNDGLISILLLLDVSSFEQVISHLSVQGSSIGK